MWTQRDWGGGGGTSILMQHWVQELVWWKATRDLFGSFCLLCGWSVLDAPYSPEAIRFGSDLDPDTRSVS